MQEEGSIRLPMLSSFRTVHVTLWRTHRHEEIRQF